MIAEFGPKRAGLVFAVGCLMILLLLHQDIIRLCSAPAVRSSTSVTCPTFTAGEWVRNVYLSTRYYGDDFFAS